MRIWWPRTPGRRPRTTGVRARGHRDLRRRPLLRRTVTWAKASPEDILWQIEVENVGPDRGAARRPSDGLVPQPMELGLRRRPPFDRDPARDRRPATSSGPPLRRVSGTAYPGGRAGARRHGCPSRCSVTTTPTRQSFGAARALLPQRRHLRSRRLRHRTGQPRAQRYQSFAFRTTWNLPRVPPLDSGCASRKSPRDLGRRFRRCAHPAQGGSGPVLRQHPPPIDIASDESDGVAPGASRDALVQAVLPLRRPTLAARRPRPSRPPSAKVGREELPLDAPFQPRGHLDARLVGVPLVRLVGPRFPRRGAGSPRPGVRQITASAARAASGTCTPTASFPPTNGTLAT